MLFHLSLNGYSQVTITMEESGGVYKVPCTVNGLKMKFVFDTGASVVSLSQSMASFMIDNGYLSESDYLGNGQTHIADGSIIDVAVVNLKDFEVGGFHLSNVTATVKDGQNVPLLMGMSAIEKLGKISLSGNKLIIHKPTVKLSAAEISSLRNEIKQQFKAKDWDGVIEKSERLKNATFFNNQWDYYYYIVALEKTEKSIFGKGIIIRELCEEWELSGISTSDKNRSEIYYIWAPHTDIEKDGSEYETLRLFKKALKFSTTLEDKCSIYSALYIYSDGLEENRIDYLKKSIEAYLEYKQISLSDIFDNKVKDHFLGYQYYNYALYEQNHEKDYSQRDLYLRLAAKCGDQEAINFCFKNNINFTK